MANPTVKATWSTDTANDLMMNNSGPADDVISVAWRLFFTNRKLFDEEIPYLKIGQRTLMYVLTEAILDEIDDEIKDDMIRRAEELGA